MTDAIDPQALSDRQLLARRQRLAASVERPELTLPGALVRQGRRCSSSGCRCRRGELHGPYLYLTLYRDGRSRSLYVPAGLEAVVGEYVGVSTRNESALDEIATVNLELLRRRKLG
ncbi:MAG: DUF6788 family protein [Solirubrobacteraceae bacterium]